MIISSKDLEKNEFLKFLGFTDSCPLLGDVREAIDDMFYNMQMAEDFSRDVYYRGAYATFEGFVKEKYSQKTYSKILEALKSNKKIYYGKFRSEEPKFGCVFCCDSIEIENDSIYFDAIKCAW